MILTGPEVYRCLLACSCAEDEGYGLSCSRTASRWAMEQEARLAARCAPERPPQPRAAPAAEQRQRSGGGVLPLSRVDPLVCLGLRRSHWGVPACRSAAGPALCGDLQRVCACKCHLMRTCMIAIGGLCGFQGCEVGHEQRLAQRTVTRQQSCVCSPHSSPPM